MDRFLAFETFRVMHRVGNARYGVALPYDYCREGGGRKTFCELGLAVKNWMPHIGLYPIPCLSRL
jgi:hypothetical protein